MTSETIIQFFPWSMASKHDPGDSSMFSSMRVSRAVRNTPKQQETGNRKSRFVKKTQKDNGSG